MTPTNHLVPPPNLVRQWIDEPQYMTEDQLGKRMYMISLNEVKFREIISKASQYGADQELEACLEHLFRRGFSDADILCLRASRRPNPPRLKAQAQVELDRLIALIPSEGALAMAEPIRRALEALPND